MGVQSLGWHYSTETDPLHPEKGNQQPHSFLVRSMANGYGYIPVCDGVCPTNSINDNFHPVPIELALFDPDNFDDYTKDRSLRAIIFNLLGFTTNTNMGVPGSAREAIWSKVGLF